MRWICLLFAPAPNAGAADLHFQIRTEFLPQGDPAPTARGGPDEHGNIWIDSQEPGGPVRTDLPPRGVTENRNLRHDSGRPDSDSHSNFPPDGIRTNSVKTIYNTYSETHITNMAGPPDAAQIHSDVADDPATPSPPGERIEYESEPPLRTEAPLVLKPTIESLIQPDWLLNPGGQSDPGFGTGFNSFFHFGLDHESVVITHHYAIDPSQFSCRQQALFHIFVGTETEKPNLTLGLGLFCPFFNCRCQFPFYTADIMNKIHINI